MFETIQIRQIEKIVIWFFEFIPINIHNRFRNGFPPKRYNIITFFMHAKALYTLRITKRNLIPTIKNNYCFDVTKETENKYLFVVPFSLFCFFFI
jgi:hypothetical protein